MRRWCIPLVVIALSVLFVGDVGACQPPPTAVIVACSDARDAPYSGYLGIQSDVRFAAIKGECGENLDALKPLIYQEFIVWYRDSYRYDGATLTFEPYSGEREASLLRQQRDLFPCHYPTYSRVGSWLKVWNVEREYCQHAFSPTSLLELRCGTASLRLSLVSFIGYIVAHPDRRTAPFLALLLLAVGLLVAAVAYRARQGQIRTFITPTPKKFVLPLMAGGLACCAGGMFDTLLVIGVTYFLVAFLHPAFAAWWALGDRAIGG